MIGNVSSRVGTLNALLNSNELTNQRGEVMKIKNFIRYKNRKLYCRKQSKYVTFTDLIDLIREGYTIGITRHDDIYNPEKAVAEGNKYIVNCFANTMDARSQSSVDLVAHEIYSMWNLS